MNIKLQRSETSIDLKLESLNGRPSVYYNKTRDWISRKKLFGLIKQNSKKLTHFEFPNIIQFDYQFLDSFGFWNESIHSSIHFNNNDENTDVIINMETASPRIKKYRWGEYLDLIRNVEEYMKVLGIDTGEDVLHIFYSSEIVKELFPHLRRNLLQDALLIGFIILFFFVFQIVNSATIVFSLMGILIVLTVSYRDFNLYRQLSKVKYDM